MKEQAEKSSSTSSFLAPPPPPSQLQLIFKLFQGLGNECKILERVRVQHKQCCICLSHQFFDSKFHHSSTEEEVTTTNKYRGASHYHTEREKEKIKRKNTPINLPPLIPESQFRTLTRSSPIKKVWFVQRTIKQLVAAPIAQIISNFIPDNKMYFWSCCRALLC